MTATLDALAADAFVRTPPHDAAAEKAIIGAAFYSADAILEVAGIIKPDDFYRPANETIWRAILALVRDGEPADSITIPARLGADLPRVGGESYLFECVAACTTAANAGYHARIVRERALSRRLIERGTRIVELGYGGGPAGEVLARAQDEVLSLDAPDQGTGRYIGPIVEDVMEAAESGVLALPTMPFPYGPEMPPMPCGRMTIVAGRPGSGKSTCGLDAARHVAIHLGLPVVFFSLEMSQAEIGARTAAAEAMIPLPHVQKGEMTERDWVRWARKVGLVLDAPLYVDEFPRADPGYIRTVCRRLTREKGQLGLVVVDHIGLMEENGGRLSKPRQQLVSEFSRSLTILAKEIGTAPVLTLAQLNRESEHRDGKKPVMSDLRESGSLEQDAAMVVLVHRDDYYDKESPRAGEADFIIAKRRNGPTDTVVLASQLHYSRFVPMATQAEPDPA